MELTDLVVPGVLALVSLAGLRQRQEVFTLMTEGAASGLELTAKILPNLVVLLCAVQLLRDSGAMELLVDIMSPFLSLLGIPPETAPLVLIRPLSGSGALAVAADIMSTYGPDSLIGRTAAVMLGSTETTFYTIAVYFGAAKIRKTRYAIPAALAADLTGFVMAALTARLMG